MQDRHWGLILGVIPSEKWLSLTHQEHHHHIEDQSILVWSDDSRVTVFPYSSEILEKMTKEYGKVKDEVIIVDNTGITFLRDFLRDGYVTAKAVDETRELLHRLLDISTEDIKNNDCDCKNCNHNRKTWELIALAVGGEFDTEEISSHI